jgi:mono/diheme cytochrome c family protein
MVNSLVITLLALGAIGWFAFLVGSGSRRGSREAVPSNLSAAQTDDELETTRLDRVLVAAVVSSAFLALALPIYYLGEADRQAGFVEEFDHTDIEHGHEVWAEFGCANCHGADGVGGAAPYLEARSQVNVSNWAAPSLNDLLYRYDRDEARFWIVYGRAGSPMPAWGLPGGGPLNEQQVDDLLDYIESFQVSQTDALTKIQGTVDAALARIDGGDASVAEQIAAQQQLIADIAAAPDLLPIAEDLAARAARELRLAHEGLDTDGDGLSDSSEEALTEIGAQALAAGLIAQAPSLSPTSVESTIGTGDDRAARTLVSQIEAEAAGLDITVTNTDVIASQAQAGLEALEAAAQARNWAIDFPALAALTFNGNEDQAMQAVGLFNGYCARCHTSGYSAGPAFQQEQAGGALGPSLRDGRANTQFLDAADMVDFLIKGSQNGVAYGVNGIGSGRMPGWGEVLSQEDIELIVQYLRGPTLDGIHVREDAG